MPKNVSRPRDVARDAPAQSRDGAAGHGDDIVTPCGEGDCGA